jgi:HK97 family phage portal protein
MTSLLGKIANRAPRPAYTSSGRSMPWGGLRANTTAYLGAMQAVSTVFSIVSRIGDAAGQVEWGLYRKQVDGRRVTAPGEQPPRVQVTRHAAADLWTTPNPFMPQNEVCETIIQHGELAGESDIVIVKDPVFGLPLELWPVRPDRMTPVPSPTEFLTGWIYTGPSGEQVPLAVGDVLQIKRAPNPLDPYRGLGPVQAALVDIGSFQAAAEWNRLFFINGAEPGGIVEVDHKVDNDEFDAFVERWRESHQGVNNAHRVAVLEGGQKWIERKYSMKDMDFAALRGVTREIIREAFGIHSHMLGLSEDVNKANAEQAEISFSRWVVQPRINRIKTILNTRLLPMFGPTGTGVEFDAGRIVPEDREADDRERTSKAQSAQLLASTGLWDPADILATVGLPPMGEVEQVAPVTEPVPA